MSMANLSLKVLYFYFYFLAIIYIWETEISFGPSIVRNIAFDQGMRTSKKYPASCQNFQEFAWAYISLNRSSTKPKVIWGPPPTEAKGEVFIKIVKERKAIIWLLLANKMPCLNLQFWFVVLKFYFLIWVHDWLPFCLVYIRYQGVGATSL